MRVAILSNSHAAALAHAARAADTVDRFTFFAADGGRLHALAADRTGLVPQNDALRAALTASAGGNGTIETDRFDAFVVYALGFMVRPLGASYSEAVREAALIDRFAGFLNAKLVTLLRGVTDKPIVCAPTPLRADGTEGEPDTPSTMDYAAMLAFTESNIAPDGVRVIGQPISTIQNGFHTDRRYNVEAPKLTAPGEPERCWSERDVNHMNAAFGARMLAAFESALAAH